MEEQLFFILPLDEDLMKPKPLVINFVIVPSAICTFPVVIAWTDIARLAIADWSPSRSLHRHGAVTQWARSQRNGTRCNGPDTVRGLYKGYCTPISTVAGWTGP
jgi:hypothetical protein